VQIPAAQVSSVAAAVSQQVAREVAILDWADDWLDPTDDGGSVAESAALAERLALRGIVCLLS
jgi:hypothetical protein